jgi:hypothetical protein
MTMRTVEATLKNTTGTEAWTITVPLDVEVAKILQRIIRDQQFGFPSSNNQGNPIAYRLLYQEGNRHLNEAETLASVGFQAGHTLVVTAETRAGSQGGAAMPEISHGA